MSPRGSIVGEISSKAGKLKAMPLMVASLVIKRIRLRFGVPWGQV